MLYNSHSAQAIGLITDDVLYYSRILGADIKLSITSSELVNIKLTSLNTWDAFLEEDAILYMSYSCRNHRGNMTIWEEFVKNISMVTSSNTSVIHYNQTSCEGKKGK